MPKINLNLREGSLEVEGEESFVKNVYEDFKNLLPEYKTKESIMEDLTSSRTILPSKGANQKISKNEAPRKKRTSKKSVPSFVKDLDLSSKTNSQDLKEFFKEKNPRNNMESNVVIVYYLKRIAKQDSISTDHVYTCYKYVDKKVPGALSQSLADTASRKGWIDTSNMNSIDIPIAGENFVEHDLPVSEE